MDQADWDPMPTMPDDEWLARVPSGNFVYLVKERCFAEVEWPYDPPGPRHVCGRVGLRFNATRRDTWFIRSNGQGIDGTQCLMPVMGQVPDEPLILPPEHVKHILRRLDRLEEIVIWGRRPRPVTVVDTTAEGSEVALMRRGRA